MAENDFSLTPSWSKSREYVGQILALRPILPLTVVFEGADADIRALVAALPSRSEEEWAMHVNYCLCGAVTLTYTLYVEWCGPNELAAFFDQSFSLAERRDCKITRISLGVENCDGIDEIYDIAGGDGDEMFTERDQEVPDIPGAPHSQGQKVSPVVNGEGGA